jgi:hypothetical protein
MLSTVRDGLDPDQWHEECCGPGSVKNYADPDPQHYLKEYQVFTHR